MNQEISQSYFDKISSALTVIYGCFGLIAVAMTTEHFGILLALTFGLSVFLVAGLYPLSKTRKGIRIIIGGTVMIALLCLYFIESLYGVVALVIAIPGGGLGVVAIIILLGEALAE